jgi:hypothetical protein
MERRRRLPVRPAHPARRRHHDRADGDSDGDRHRPRRAARDHAPVAQPARVGRELVLHLVLPRHASARAAFVLVQHRRPLPNDRARHPVRPVLHPRECEHADHAVHRGDPRAGAERGRLHGGDRPGGDHLRRRGPGRRGPITRHDTPSDDAQDRAAAGDERDHPADRERDDLDAQELIARERDRRDRAVVRRAADLLGQLQDDPAVDRRELLVHPADPRAVRRGSRGQSSTPLERLRIGLLGVRSGQL